MNKRQLLETLRRDAESLSEGDEAAIDKWRRRAEMIIAKLFGADGRYAHDLAKIHFYPMVYPASDEYRRSAFSGGRTEALNLVDTMAEDLELLESFEEAAPASRDARAVTSNVFVVHGHDDAMKEAVARTLEQLGLHPIILHEQANQGRTLIEKFTDHADVSFAVALLSADDVARGNDEPPEKMKTRARQNVIFELGFFMGRLGRERVVAMYRQDDDFEMPSDYSGVVYVPFDANWRLALVQELRAAGFNVDANKVV